MSEFVHNYAQFGWIEALTGAGRQVIGLDFCGHGGSERPYDPARYATAHLARDARALLDTWASRARRWRPTRSAPRWRFT